MSGTTRRLRLIPPASQYWQVSQVAFPASGGLVAPGMAAAVTVRFTPDSDADVRDAFTVDTELARFAVPLLAVREPPVIGLAACIDVGSVYRGNTVTHKVDVAGVEGSGAYQIFDADAWRAACKGVDTAGREAESVSVGGAFVLRPARFALQEGGTVQLQVEFDAALSGASIGLRALSACMAAEALLHTAVLTKVPLRSTRSKTALARAGVFEAACVLVCNNCHVKEVALRGTVLEPRVLVSSMDGVALSPATAASALATGAQFVLWARRSQLAAWLEPAVR